MNTENTVEEIPSKDVILAMDNMSNGEIVSDRNLLDFLTHLQKKAVGVDSQSSQTLPLVAFEKYHGVLRQAGVREHLLDRVVKSVLYVTERGFTLPDQSALETNGLDPFVKQQGDKGVIKLFRRYGIYKIIFYNKTKTEFGFLVFTTQHGMLEISVQRHQRIPLKRGSKEVKVSMNDAVGLILASIINVEQMGLFKKEPSGDEPHLPHVFLNSEKGPEPPEFMTLSEFIDRVPPELDNEA